MSRLIVYVINKHTGRIEDTLVNPQVIRGKRIDDGYWNANVNDMAGILSKPFPNSFHGGRTASCFVPTDRAINRSL